MEEAHADHYVALCDGDLRLWVEQETVHIKAADKFGDPVELNEHEARLLAAQLLRLADAIS